MFAYCGNNPVSFVDPLGSSPYGALSIIDYYWIHRAVQDHASKQTGWMTEVYVSGSKGAGRLDLYDVYDNTYYEVKSRGAAYIPTTKRQMQKYDQAKPNAIVSIFFGHDEKVTRSQEKISGSFKYGMYDVTYKNEADGLIVYDVELNWNRAAKYLLTLAFAGLALLTSGASLASGAPVVALK